MHAAHATVKTRRVTAASASDTLAGAPMPTADTTGPPDATWLALERTRLAYERTLMAWTRTATSLISFGFTIYKFFQYLREQERVTDTSVIGPHAFGLLMMSIGLAALALATIQHRRELSRLRASYGPLPYSLAAVVAFLVAILGVAGLVAVLFRM
jgi:putative membrane protein